MIHANGDLRPRRVRANLLGMVLLLASIAVGQGCADRPDHSTSPASAQGSAEQQRARQILREALAHSEGWELIHGLESCIATGEPFDLGPALERARSQASGVMGLRIGVWRVRARLARTPDQRNRWIGKIRGVLEDPQAPDRLHAVESLAKLGVSAQRSDRAALDEVAQTNAPAAVPFILWLNANAGDAPSVRPRLLELIRSDNDLAALRAAYTLQHLGGLTRTQWRALTAGVDQHRDNPLVYGYQLIAAYALAPDREARVDRREAVRRALGQAPTGVRYQWGKTLAEYGITTELPLAAAMMNDPQRDPRIAAAEAVLRLQNRQ